jgi:Asp-tRNA(Asn)/Glu-tRNA(Gln) amidotransferase A subunit family amidase
VVVERIIYASTTDLADAIRQKEVSSEEVVSAHLDRIEAVNPALNAVVQVSGEQALEQARAADAALAAGDARGPRHGVPMTIKDNLDTAGVISTGGTQGRAAFVPEQDATVVARLRNAGSILLGKTNTPELTLAYETDNIVYGRTPTEERPSVVCSACTARPSRVRSSLGSENSSVISSCPRRVSSTPRSSSGASITWACSPSWRTTT